jgi:hypothetical protein
VGRIGDFFRGIFSFTGAKSGQEERVAAYLIREHDRGRSIQEILDDPYVRNRCSPQEIERVLERPDVIKSIGDDMARAARNALTAG